MKQIIFFFFLPFLLVSQDTTIMGDVDCNGELNTEDASLILQYVTSVIDSLPCQENMSGLTADQLQEIVELMDSQLTINYEGMSFGDWVLKYDNPSFDYFIYGQEENDGFLLLQYSRENQINSSASFFERAKSSKYPLILTLSPLTTSYPPVNSSDAKSAKSFNVKIFFSPRVTSIPGVKPL